MANPKRRHSNARTRTRRAHDWLSVPSLSKCAHCGESVMPHRICSKCGYYKGRQRITIKTKEKSESKP